jgi:hypothetical protein
MWISLIRLVFAAKRSHWKGPIGDRAMNETPHTTDSSLREKLIEHIFIGELLRCLWMKGVRNVEVLRPEVDMGGYDVAIECNNVLRHVQLKSSHKSATTRRVNVNLNLAVKPNGCVIWIIFDAETLAVGPFFWFGNLPNQSKIDLGTRTARHTRANHLGQKSERHNIRTLARGQFDRLDTVSDVVARLFGP